MKAICGAVANRHVYNKSVYLQIAIHANQNTTDKILFCMLTGKIYDRSHNQPEISNLHKRICMALTPSKADSDIRDKQMDRTP